MTESFSFGADSPVRRPLNRVERRVLGVLVEKAKTTPDNYPLTVASIVAGANQKSNRDPQMQLDEDDVLGALDSLREAGAVRQVQGSGRVDKFRHSAYEWLDVNAPQAAIMTELLLRGTQTAGELRARASRMEPFDSLDRVSETLQQLEQKGLVRQATPPGRGQLFAHTLYENHEIEKVQRAADASSAREDSDVPASGNVPERGPTEGLSQKNELQELRAEFEALRSRVKKLEDELGIVQD